MPTVVVVDDDEVIRTALVHALRNEQYNVLAFPDAAPALDRVDFSEVDLVITDLQMPLLGEQLILVLREKGVEVPVIVMSAYLKEDRVRYLQDMGVHQFLEKPFRLSSLVETVKGMLTCAENP